MKPIRLFTVVAMLAAMLGLASSPAGAAEGDEINLIGQRYSVQNNFNFAGDLTPFDTCLLYTSPSPRDKRQSRMPSSA